MIRLEHILKNIENISIDQLNELLDEVSGYFKENIGSFFDEHDGIIRFEPKYKYAYIFGDIHGDLDTLVKFLKMIKFNETIKDSILIFLGDYIDRGYNQVETVTLVFYLIRFYPDKVILLRGNHEPPEWLPPYPHDFPNILYSYFRGEAKKIYRRFIKVFNLMPHIAYYNNGLAFLHGGVPINEVDISRMGRKYKDILTQILWNDPIDGEGVQPSYRGVGYLYGTNITKKFLEYNNLMGIIRGHEPVDGYRISQEGMLLTLFSRLGGPYWNSKAAIYRLDFKNFTSFSVKDIILIYA